MQVCALSSLSAPALHVEYAERGNKFTVFYSH